MHFNRCRRRRNELPILLDQTFFPIALIGVSILSLYKSFVFRRPPIAKPSVAMLLMVTEIASLSESVTVLSNAGSPQTKTSQNIEMYLFCDGCLITLRKVEQFI